MSCMVVIYQFTVHVMTRPNINEHDKPVREPELVSRRRAVELTGVSLRTLERLANRGRITEYRKALPDSDGNWVFYDLNEIKALRKARPVSGPGTRRVPVSA